LRSDIQYDQCPSQVLNRHLTNKAQNLLAINTNVSTYRHTHLVPTLTKLLASCWHQVEESSWSGGKHCAHTTRCFSIHFKCSQWCYECSAYRL